MKCPQCGQWNKASFPKCFRCGFVFPNQPEYLRNQPSDWEYDIEINQKKQKVYVQIDEDGDQQKLVDKRDQLAQEMTLFKERKKRGEKVQKILREQSVQKGIAPSSRTLRRDTSRDNFFSISDSPETALRPRPEALVEGEEISKETYRAFTNEYSTAIDPSFFTNTTSSSFSEDMLEDDPFATTTYLQDTQQLYDGFDDTYAYEPLWQDAQRKGNYTSTTTFKGKKIPSSHRGFRRIFRFFLIALLITVISLTIYSGVTILLQRKQEQASASAPIVMASIFNDQAAHTILIPGEEGTEIYVRERQTSYPVINGVATIEIPDYIWYEGRSISDLGAVEYVSLTPYIKLLTGDLKPMDPINFTVDIPLSRIDLIAPDSAYAEISKGLYTIKLKVEPGSKLYINNEDLSDLVNNETGEVSHNATVQPIGENVFTIRVQSEYARENTLDIVLYRAYQEIPLDISVVLTDRTFDEKITVSAETLIGATVNVLSPHTDLDITNLDINGTFTFTALFDHYGSNTITLTADYPEKKQSIVNYDVIYVPTPEIYTKKAHPMDTEYANYLANTAVKVKQSQIYLCKGTITEFISQKPQLAIMNIGTEEKPLHVLVENGTRTTWQVDTYYRLYADAYGLYGEIPRLTARYTYTD
ncbi:MAG: hypothetical protein GX786_04480 [Clostridiales bacterium]|nr:hypothetical protein [Clostridiales bacterium]